MALPVLPTDSVELTLDTTGNQAALAWPFGLYTAISVLAWLSSHRTSPVGSGNRFPVKSVPDADVFVSLTCVAVTLPVLPTVSSQKCAGEAPSPGAAKARMLPSGRVAAGASSQSYTVLPTFSWKPELHFPLATE